MIVLTVCILILSLFIARLFSFKLFQDRRLLKLAEKKRLYQQDLIREFKKNHPLKLTKAKLDLIKNATTIKELHALYLSKKLNVYDVVFYYCHAAIESHEKLNCLTELMLEEALEQSKEMDSEFRQTGKLSGPLHGVPVSLKDTISFKSRDSTVGIIKRAFAPKSDHSPIVHQLIDAGAVPFVKTNVPQTMMTFECRNPLWGRTKNPFNPNHTPGGSSGGEAALLASNGTFIGIGSDVGGSLRIPAHFSGVYALKPSWNRISYTDSQGYYPASISIRPVNGPMVRNMSDLQTLANALMQKYPLDMRMMVPKELSAKKKLKFGIAFTDGFVDSTPPIRRALEIVKDALEQEGHEIISFDYPSNISDYIILFYSIMGADGCKHFMEALKGEPIDSSLVPFFTVENLPNWLHSAISALLEAFIKDRRFTSLFSVIREKSVFELIDLEGRKVELQKEFDRLWIESNIDILICPPNAMPAPPYNTFADLNFTASYTVLWNLLDYSAGVLPVTTVDSSKDKADERQPFSRQNVLEHFVSKFYDAEEMKGLPVGVQIVAPPYQEETVLQAMNIIDRVLNK